VSDSDLHCFPRDAVSAQVGSQYGPFLRLTKCSQSVSRSISGGQSVRHFRNHELGGIILQVLDLGVSDGPLDCILDAVPFFWSLGHCGLGVCSTLTFALVAFGAAQHAVLGNLPCSPIFCFTNLFVSLFQSSQKHLRLRDGFGQVLQAGNLCVSGGLWDCNVAAVIPKLIQCDTVVPLYLHRDEDCELEDCRLSLSTYFYDHALLSSIMGISDSSPMSALKVSSSLVEPEEEH